MKKRSRTPQIRDFLLDNIEYFPTQIVSVAARELCLSRQAMLRHMNALIREGAVSATGKARARHYELRELQSFSEVLRVAGLAEDIAWTNSIEPVLSAVPRNVTDMIAYGFTEMLNTTAHYFPKDFCDTTLGGVF